MFQWKSKNGIQYRNVYDLEWNLLPVKFGKTPAPKEARPERLDEMLNFAEKLSKGFPFVRVDFNNTKDRLYFGEMTFTSGSGFTKIDPIEFDYELGSYLQLPQKC